MIYYINVYPLRVPLQRKVLINITAIYYEEKNKNFLKRYY